MADESNESIELFKRQTTKEALPLARRVRTGKLKSESFTTANNCQRVQFNFNRPLTLLELEGLVATVDRAIAR